MAIDVLLLIGLTVAALGAVMKRETVKAAIALALSSIILAILLYRLLSPLAAVFELSVCAGLITVIFMSTVSLTKSLTKSQEDERLHTLAPQFAVLPMLVVGVGILLVYIGIPSFTLGAAAPAADVRTVIWNERQIDLVGQVLVILAGFFGVLVLFKERPAVKSQHPAARMEEEVPKTATPKAEPTEAPSHTEEPATEPVLR